MCDADKIGSGAGVDDWIDCADILGEMTGGYPDSVVPLMEGTIGKFDVNNVIPPTAITDEDRENMAMGLHRLADDAYAKSDLVDSDFIDRLLEGVTWGPDNKVKSAKRLNIWRQMIARMITRHRVMRGIHCIGLNQLAFWSYECEADGEVIVRCEDCGKDIGAIIGGAID